MNGEFGSREYFQALAAIAEAQPRIYQGLRVVVSGGRKHLGKTGTVTRHQRSRYSNALRYASGASLDLRIMMGRAGFVALITPENGEPAFWCACEHLTPAVSP